MKNLFRIGVMVFVCIMLFAACSTTDTQPTAGESAVQPEVQASAQSPDAALDDTEKQIRVCCILNGSLGDKAFFDSCNLGMQKIQERFGVEIKVIEAGADETKLEPAFIDMSEQGYDLIICTTFTVADVLTKVSQQFPDQKYVILDTIVEGDNIYSCEFKQNEASYLSGALAAMMTTSDAPNINEDHVIGCLAAIPIPVINDFIVGYIQGATDMDPEIKVPVAYTGGFDDTAKGKELSLGQYSIGADIIFTAAGRSGLGALDAAKESKLYAFGDGADQYIAFMGSDPEKANQIISSTLKNADAAIVTVVEKYLKGELQFGISEKVGLAEGAVGLAKNENYVRLVPAHIQTKIDQLEVDIISGKIIVQTAYGMETVEIEEIINSVKP